MAENQRAPRHHVVDELIAIDIPDVRAGGASDKAGRAADGSKRRTGELTPPGSRRFASSNRAAERRY